MKLISFLFFIPSVVAFIWPVALIFKKRMTDSQWIFSLVQILTGFSIALFSLYFNPDMRGEYFLSLLFSVFALITPMVYFLYVCRLSSPMGVSVKNRKFLLVPLIMILLMVAIALVAGRDSYRTYLDIAVYGGDVSLTSSLAHNVLVIVNYYLFFIVLLVEVVAVSLYAMMHLSTYNKFLKDNGTDRYPLLHSTLAIQIASILCILLVAAVWIYVIYFPNNWIIVCIISVLFCLVQLYLGAYSFFTPDSMVDLLQKRKQEALNLNNNHNIVNQVEQMKNVQDQLIDYVEKHEGFCNSELTFIRLADMLNITPNELVNLIQTEYGCTYAEYIDGLRINKAINLLLSRCRTESGDIDKSSINNIKVIEETAYLCGYNSLSSFYSGFSRVMSQSFSSWLAE